MMFFLSMLLLCPLFSQAQQPVAKDPNVVVPPLMNFSGVLTDGGRPITQETAVTFLLYKESQGGSPLWMESRNVKPDRAGHHSVMLRATSSQGLPAEIFVADQAHWLAVLVQGQEEQPRVLLVSAPYALKAGDAETIGGLPPSAFVLAAPPSGLPATTTANNGIAASNACFFGTSSCFFQCDHQRRHGQHDCHVYHRDEHSELHSHSDRNDRGECRRQTEPAGDGYRLGISRLQLASGSFRCVGVQ